QLARVRVVNLRQTQLARADVFPNICFGPVRNWGDADIFASHLATVVQVPQLWALTAWVPSTKGVTHGEDALFGTRAFFIAARTTKHGVIASLSDGFYQRHRLQRVTCAIRAFLQVTAVNPILDLSYVQACSGFFHQLIAELDDLREVMAGINV